METASGSIASAVHGETLVVTVLSEQLRDFAVVQALRSSVIEAIERTQAKNVVMDLGNVTYIGSVAFLAFLAIRRQSGIDRIVLCNLSELVQELFRMCKLIASSNGKAAPFEQASTQADALALCGEAA